MIVLIISFPGDGRAGCVHLQESSWTVGAGRSGSASFEGDREDELDHKLIAELQKLCTSLTVSRVALSVTFIGIWILPQPICLSTEGASTVCVYEKVFEDPKSFNPLVFQSLAYCTRPGRCSIF